VFTCVNKDWRVLSTYAVGSLKLMETLMHIQNRYILLEVNITEHMS
jgi:hypothetical protein